MAGSVNYLENPVGVTCFVTFADLVFNAAPPLELLRLAKLFFKQQIQEYPRGSVEWQAAYLFYVLCIAAAGADAAQVSSLAPSEVSQGVGWALEQTWIDERTRKFLTAFRELAARSSQ